MAARGAFIGGAAPPAHPALGQQPPPPPPPPHRRRFRHAARATAAMSALPASRGAALRRSRWNAPRCHGGRGAAGTARVVARTSRRDVLDSGSSTNDGSGHEEMFLFDEEMRSCDLLSPVFQSNNAGGVDDHDGLDDHGEWLNEHGGVVVVDNDDNDDDNNKGDGDGDFLLDNEQAAAWAAELDHGDDVAERMLRAAGYAVVPRNEGGHVAPSSSPSWPPGLGRAVPSASTTGAHPLIECPQRAGSDMLLQFARKGHAALRGLLPPDEVRALAAAVQDAFDTHGLDAYRQALGALLSPEAAAAVSTPEEAQEVLDTKRIHVPFLQLFNLHTSVPDVERIAKSSNLGRIAAELLGVDAVRLYQDSAFWKRSGDGPTPWHTDLKMAPIDTNDFVTFFIPLRALPGGRHAPSLRFASGSHRDVAASYWFNVRANEAMDLSSRYSEESHGALALGDATAHHGWTLHASPAVPAESRGRMALTISYVSTSARVLPRNQQKLIHTEDSRSYARWIGRVKAGKRLRHDLLPIVYSNGTGP
jgi:hypothetical protein